MFFVDVIKSPCVRVGPKYIDVSLQGKRRKTRCTDTGGRAL